MKLNSDRIAIILEVLSFFLVTIDLFGKDRIEALQHRFETSVSKLKAIDLKQTASNLTSLDPKIESSDAPYGIAWLVSLALTLIYGNRLLLWRGWWYVLFIAISIVLSLFEALLLMLLLYCALVVMEFVIDSTFDVLLFMFKRLKLEGSMIIIGACLFLLSKVIAFIYVPVPGK